ncbi:MAG: YchJ family protein [Chlamydiales bacterium]
MKQLPCPCDTGKSYAACCGRYHAGALPENALMLMRSRYSAYAKGSIDYIIQTTHPGSEQKKEKNEWEQEIRDFSENTQFIRLEIHDFEDGETIAHVTFTAHLSQNGHDISFRERSLFEKLGQKWLYVRPEVLENL